MAKDISIKKAEDDKRQQRLQSRLTKEVCDFRDARQTLHLATTDASGKPNASYAPFAFDHRGYYILVSDLAVHGRNLKHCCEVSIMMIEDESDSRQIHARKRLTFDTQAELISRDSNQWQQGLNALRQRFGDIIDNLSQLGDFHLYRLVPESGRYVKGFGQAFEVAGADLLEFIPMTEGHIKQ
ncbi:heme utilization protein HutZ [Vibrio sp.]|uniref:heme utilization protein HutZ n=1 Tax=Vibrio sp. TaxID=678 RepID=UPI003D12BF1E